MVPITELKNGDLKIAPTGQKPQGIAAWLGENFGTGMMIAAAIGAVATIFFAPQIAASIASGGTAHWGVSALLPALPTWIPNIGLLAAGGLAGAYMDKRQSERNAVEGVTVKKPGFFNRGILTEGLLKGGLNGLVLAVSAVTIIGTMLLPMVGVSALSIGALGVTGTAIAGAIGAAIGAVRGSISRKDKMDKVYKQVQTAYFIQTGQVERARGVMQGMGVAAPALAAGVGVGAGVAASGNAKVGVVDPSAIKTAIGVTTGLQDAPSKEEHYIKQVAQAEAKENAELERNPYDFSGLENHPAYAASQRSFAQAELERRAAASLGQQSPAV